MAISTMELAQIVWCARRPAKRATELQPTTVSHAAPIDTSTRISVSLHVLLAPTFSKTPICVISAILCAEPASTTALSTALPVFLTSSTLSPATLVSTVVPRQTSTQCTTALITRKSDAKGTQ